MTVNYILNRISGGDDKLEFVDNTGKRLSLDIKNKLLKINGIAQKIKSWSILMDVCNSFISIEFPPIKLKYDCISYDKNDDKLIDFYLGAAKVAFLNKNKKTVTIYGQPEDVEYGYIEITYPNMDEKITSKRLREPETLEIERI